jgi:hypothetical protein
MMWIRAVCHDATITLRVATGAHSARVVVAEVKC